MPLDVWISVSKDSKKKNFFFSASWIRDIPQKSPSLTNRKFHQGDKQQTTDDRHSNYRLNQSEGQFSGNFKYFRNICLVPLPFRRFSLFFHSIFIKQPLDMPCLLNVKTWRIWIFSKELFSCLKKCLNNIQWRHGWAIQANNYSRHQPYTSWGQTFFLWWGLSWSWFYLRDGSDQ